MCAIQREVRQEAMDTTPEQEALQLLARIGCLRLLLEPSKCEAAVQTDLDTPQPVPMRRQPSTSVDAKVTKEVSTAARPLKGSPSGLAAVQATEVTEADAIGGRNPVRGKARGKGKMIGNTKPRGIATYHHPGHEETVQATTRRTPTNKVDPDSYPQLHGQPPLTIAQLRVAAKKINTHNIATRLRNRHSRITMARPKMR